jgi:hypothetical protein
MPTYDKAKEALRSDALVALPLALERIEDNPDHMLQRRRRPDGSVVDYGVQGLLVAFRRIDDRTVHLLDVIDLTDAPSLF